MPAGNQTTNSFEALVARLHESHESAVYEAIDRFVQAAEAVGPDPQHLLWMLDRGMTFEGLLESIESKMECLQRTVLHAGEPDKAA